MIDTTTGSMQLSHKLELTPKHYPGITHLLHISLSLSLPSLLLLPVSVIPLHKFFTEITCILLAVSILGADACVIVHICFSLIAFIPHLFCSVKMNQVALLLGLQLTVIFIIDYSEKLF